MLVPVLVPGTTPVSVPPDWVCDVPLVDVDDVLPGWTVPVETRLPVPVCCETDADCAVEEVVELEPLPWLTVLPLLPGPISANPPGTIGGISRPAI
jgi:hypothetical protein